MYDTAEKGEAMGRERCLWGGGDMWIAGGVGVERLLVLGLEVHKQHKKEGATGGAIMGTALQCVYPFG
jgi:hypothetical protein